MPGMLETVGTDADEREETMLNTSESRSQAMDKLNALVTKGRTSAGAVIEHVMQNQPTDRIIKGGAITFAADHARKAITIDAQNGSPVQTIHRNALGQMAQAVDVPMKFLDSLQEERADWGRELLATNFQTIFHERFAKKRYLSRSVNTQVRGWLSDSYRRLDSRPIVEAFASAVQEKGAHPYAGVVTDTKIAIQAIMPTVYEPIPGELVAYGLSLENSDFGNGALSLRAYLLRIWCTNLAITEETMRQVHLGKRLDDNMVYSQHTYELDSRATVSALKDVVKLQLDSKSLDNRMDAVRAANAQEVNPTNARELLKKVLNKGEAEAAINAYNSPDVYNLPAGNTTWRLSNAISWIAGQTEEPERKLALMRVAGDVLPKA
jgi:hypothetical protein